MKNLPNLYPLRFLLSVIVVIYHLPLISKGLHIPYFSSSPIFYRGTLAVFYFFTLSGFLILRLIFIELEKTNDFNFKKFYLRRIARLYPVYYIVLFVGIFLYHYLLPKLGIPFSIDYTLSDLILNYVFIIPNVFKYYHEEVGGILIILWSIGVEEQFYLFIPLFLYLVRKRILLGIALLLGLLLLLLLLFPGIYKYDNLYFYFIFGGLLSILGVKKKILFFENKYFHLIVYVLFVLSFTTDLLNFENFALASCFHLLVSGSLISLITDYPKFIIKNKTIDYLGKISYGIYMYHMIIITATLFFVNKFKVYNHLNDRLFIILLNLFVIGSTIIVAHFSFKYFESLFYKAHVPQKLN